MKKEDCKEELDRLNHRETVQQTMLSWIQTGLALIGLGFAIGSIIALMEAHHYQKLIIKAIRIIGGLLLLVGIFSIIFPLIQHKKKLRSIKNKDYRYEPSHDFSFTVGVMVFLLGIVAFLSILIHTIYTYSPKK